MDANSSNRILSFFREIPFSTGQKEAFLAQWKSHSFRQNELITQAGSIESNFYIVIEGVQAIYLLNKKGEKVVLGFSYPGSPSGVFDSFIFQKPSDTFLEALKPSVLYGISQKNYLALFEHHPDFHRWGHLFFRDILFGRLYREVELLTLTAEERYVAFMQRCPKELTTIPQKYLASYLNMKPETFSRLRASVHY